MNRIFAIFLPAIFLFQITHAMEEQSHSEHTETLVSDCIWELQREGGSLPKECNDFTNASKGSRETKIVIAALLEKIKENPELRFSVPYCATYLGDFFPRGQITKEHCTKYIRVSPDNKIVGIVHPSHPFYKERKHLSVAQFDLPKETCLRIDLMRSYDKDSHDIDITLGSKYEMKNSDKSKDCDTWIKDYENRTKKNGTLYPKCNKIKLYNRRGQKYITSYGRSIYDTTGLEYGIIRYDTYPEQDNAFYQIKLFPNTVCPLQKIYTYRYSSDHTYAYNHRPFMVQCKLDHPEWFARPYQGNNQWKINKNTIFEGTNACDCKILHNEQEHPLTILKTYVDRKNDNQSVNLPNNCVISEKDPSIWFAMGPDYGLQFFHVTPLKDVASLAGLALYLQKKHNNSSGILRTVDTLKKVNANWSKTLIQEYDQ